MILYCRMLQAIIFDFDGVIVDSEPLHFKATRSAFADLGVHLDSLTYQEECIGRPDAENYRRLSKKFQWPLSDHQMSSFLQAKSDHYHRLNLQESQQVYPGVAALIKAAAQEYPLAICSGSFKAEIRRLLSQVCSEDLAPYFKEIVGIEDVPAGKPDPAGYRLAAERLGALPEFCLAIEDSPAGIIAAKTAGMKVLAVISTHPEEKLTLADYCVKSLENLTPADLADICRSD